MATKPPGLIQQFSNWRNERKKQHRIEVQEEVVRGLKDERARHEARLAALKKRYARGEGKSAELEAEINDVQREITTTLELTNLAMRLLLEIRRSDDGDPGP